MLKLAQVITVGLTLQGTLLMTFASFLKFLEATFVQKSLVSSENLNGVV